MAVRQGGRLPGPSGLHHGQDREGEVEEEGG